MRFQTVPITSSVTFSLDFFSFQVPCTPENLKFPQSFVRLRDFPKFILAAYQNHATLHEDVDINDFVTFSRNNLGLECILPKCILVHKRTQEKLIIGSASCKVGFSQLHYLDLKLIAYCQILHRYRHFRCTK